MQATDAADNGKGVQAALAAALPELIDAVSLSMPCREMCEVRDFGKTANSEGCQGPCHRLKAPGRVAGGGQPVHALPRDSSHSLRKKSSTSLAAKRTAGVRLLRCRHQPAAATRLVRTA